MCYRPHLDQSLGITLDYQRRENARSSYCSSSNGFDFIAREEKKQKYMKKCMEIIRKYNKSKEPMYKLKFCRDPEKCDFEYDYYWQDMATGTESEQYILQHCFWSIYDLRKRKNFMEAAKFYGWLDDDEFMIYLGKAKNKVHQYEKMIKGIELLNTPIEHRVEKAKELFPYEDITRKFIVNKSKETARDIMRMDEKPYIKIIFYHHEYKKRFIKYYIPENDGKYISNYNIRYFKLVPYKTDLISAFEHNYLFDGLSGNNNLNVEVESIETSNSPFDDERIKTLLNWGTGFSESAFWTAKGIIWEDENEKNRLDISYSRPNW